MLYKCGALQMFAIIIIVILRIIIGPIMARTRVHVQSSYCNMLQRTCYREYVTENIIIIINFHGAYILRNLSSEAQQNRIITHNREQGRVKVIIRTIENQRFMVEMQIGINISRVFFGR